MADGYIQQINQLQSDITEINGELGVDPGGVYANVRVRLDILEARINNPNLPSPTVDNPFTIGNDGVTISTGSPFPTSNEVDGSLYLRQDGYAYIRQDSSWVILGSSGGGGASLTLQDAFDNQGNTPTVQSTDINIDIDDGYLFKFRNSASEDIITIKGTDGGYPIVTVECQYFTSNATDNNFTNSIFVGGSEGISIRDNNIETAGALTISLLNELALNSDGYKILVGLGSNYYIKPEVNGSNGNHLTISGQSTTSNIGGNLLLKGGDATGTTGGNLNLYPGIGSSTYGKINLIFDENLLEFSKTGNNGSVKFTDSDHTIVISQANANSSDSAKKLTIQSSGNTGSGNAGELYLKAGNSTSGTPGNVRITAGEDNSSIGGDILLESGTGNIKITIKEDSVIFFNGDASDGEGVIAIDDADVMPTTPPADGIILYSEASTLKYLNASGDIVILDGYGTGSLAPERPTYPGSEAEYRFDEASGSIINYGSASSADMSVAGSSTGTVRYGYPGPYGDGFRMPAGTTFETGAVVTAATTQMTLWVVVSDLDTTPSACAMFARQKTAEVSNLLAVGINISGTFLVQYNNGSGGQQVLSDFSTETYIKQKVTFAAVVYDVTDANPLLRGFTGYIDGVKVGFYNLSGTVDFSASAKWVVGSTNGVVQTVNMAIFAAGAYPGALTESEIKSLYKTSIGYP